MELALGEQPWVFLVDHFFKGLQLANPEIELIDFTVDLLVQIWDFLATVD